MKISLEEQQTRDFDWFCLDEAGEIGHFATAGFKSLPQSVASSAEDLQALTTFFEQQPELTPTYMLDENLAKHIPEADERYLQSYVAMAKRGLYSFDIETYLTPNSAYFRVALPAKALTVKELPEEVQLLLQCTRLSGKKLTNTPALAYQDTLAM